MRIKCIAPGDSAPSAVAIMVGPARPMVMMIRADWALTAARR